MSFSQRREYECFAVFSKHSRELNHHGLRYVLMLDLFSGVLGC